MNIDEITQTLCRPYPIPCPACGAENQFLRPKPDVYRATDQEPDGHPLKINWRAEGEFPEWVTPLNYFWAVCPSCCFTGQLDEAEFRTWKKIERKYLALFHEGALESLATQANVGQGTAQVLAKGIQSADVYGTILAQFHLGVFTECQKTSPVPNLLARSYQRIAWVYRDAERLYQPFLEASGIQGVLEEAEATWSDEIPPNDGYPVPPTVVHDEVEALRLVLSYYEWNFVALQSTKHEDTIRLMILIAETGFRIYELTDDADDFQKALTLFSGAMQKSLSIMNDKSIVGGAVNVARDALDKTGERGRELRALRDRREKQGKGKAKAAPAKPKAKAEAKPAKKASAAPAKPEPEPEPAAQEEAPAPPAPEPMLEFQPTSGTQELEKRIAQLDEDNKRWMRLAGISELTGLPNRVMLSRVLLPGASKQAASRRESLGCIMVSPGGIPEVNAKHGHQTGDALIRQFSECLKGLLRKGERLSHTEGVNFAVLVPGLQTHQLKKRAEALHKDLSARRFDLDREALSLDVSMGVGITEAKRGATEVAPVAALYTHALEALDRAKVQGSYVEIWDAAAGG